MEAGEDAPDLVPAEFRPATAHRVVTVVWENRELSGA